jgi:hypothetical protein
MIFILEKKKLTLLFAFFALFASLTFAVPVPEEKASGSGSTNHKEAESEARKQAQQHARASGYTQAYVPHARSDFARHAFGQASETHANHGAHQATIANAHRDAQNNQNKQPK